MPYKNPEDKKQFQKLYYQQNKDMLNQKQSRVCQCECGDTYTARHKARHLQSIKHLTKLETIPTTESN